MSAVGNFACSHLQDGEQDATAKADVGLRGRDGEQVSTNVPMREKRSASAPESRDTTLACASRWFTLKAVVH